MIVIYEGNERFKFKIGDSVFYFRQLSEAEESRIYAESCIEQKKGEGVPQFSEVNWKKNRVMHGVTGWDNVGDKRGNPVTFNADWLRRLVDSNAILVQGLHLAMLTPTDYPNNVELIDDAPPALDAEAKND